MTQVGLFQLEKKTPACNSALIKLHDAALEECQAVNISHRSYPRNDSLSLSLYHLNLESVIPFPSAGLKGVVIILRKEVDFLSV